MKPKYQQQSLIVLIHKEIFIARKETTTRVLNPNFTRKEKKRKMKTDTLQTKNKKMMDPRIIKCFWQIVAKTLNFT